MEAPDNGMFRKAESKDIAAIENIYKSAHDAEEAGLSTTGWKRGIYPVKSTAEASLDRGDLYVAEVDGQVVATAIINQQQVDVYDDVEWKYKAPDDQISVIHTLVVGSSAQGHGIGKAFIKYWEDQAREQGCTALRLDTNATNARARKMYKDLGYDEVGIVPTVFNGIKNINLVMLEKQLRRL